MSRTYRRTEKGQKRSWMPNIHCWDIEEGHWHRYWKVDPWAVAWLKKNPHRLKDVGDWFHWMTEPSWHNRMMSTRPRRHAERALCRKIVREGMDLDEVVFPLHTKPHCYYW